MTNRSCPEVVVMTERIEKDYTAEEVVSSWAYLSSFTACAPSPNTRACLQAKEKGVREMSSTDMLLMHIT